MMEGHMQGGHRRRTRQAQDHPSLPQCTGLQTPRHQPNKRISGQVLLVATASKDVQEYVKGCAQCQQNKANTHPQKVPLNPITPTIGALPFQTISMDFIIKLPESAGYNSILTITDHNCTKMLIAIPCRETITAEGVAELFLRQIFPRFGLPSKIISDRDPRFVSKFMKELCHLMGITQNVSTAYHP